MLLGWIPFFVLASPPDKQPIYPFPPANPCSNPVKCDRQPPARPVTLRLGRGVRK